MTVTLGFCYETLEVPAGWAGSDPFFESLCPDSLNSCLISATKEPAAANLWVHLSWFLRMVKYVALEEARRPAGVLQRETGGSSREVAAVTEATLEVGL